MPESADQTTITWLGHSTVLIESGSVRVLTDPLLRRRTAHLRRRVPVPVADWPARIDCILISHLHLDHFDPPTLRRFGVDIPLLVPVGAGRTARGFGFRNVEEVPVGAVRVIGGLAIAAVPAAHSGYRPPFGPSAEAIGYVVRGAHTTYFAGDTDIFPGMADIGQPLDCALIPVWGWGRSLGTGHLDPLRAAEALELLNPRIAIPIHWGTLHPYGTGLRDRRFLEEPPRLFQREAAMRAPRVDVRVLTPGQPTTIDLPRGAGAGTAR
jgi:L-ascorbate metabolism protein UlaG (beta-lactamase superfamily)